MPTISTPRCTQSVADEGVIPGPELHLDGADASPAARQSRAAGVTPLAPGRYKVQFTASAGLREKLERLQSLMRSSVPDGDLGRDHRVSGQREAGEDRIATLRSNAKPQEGSLGKRHFPRDASCPGGRQASRARTRRRPLPLRGRQRPTVRCARRARVPPSSSVRLRRRPLRRERLSRLSGPQCLSGRGRLRPIRHGPAPIAGGVPSGGHNLLRHEGSGGGGGFCTVGTTGSIRRIPRILVVCRGGDFVADERIPIERRPRSRRAGGQVASISARDAIAVGDQPLEQPPVSN